MKIRNIFPLALIGASALFMTGCLDDGSLSTIEYNNTVVETLNSTSAVIEETTDSYDLSVPNIVTEESEIDTTDMETALLSAQAKVTEAKTVLDLISKNAEQQEAVMAEFTNYLELGEAYVVIYETVTTYYSAQEYIESLDLVAEYDESLHSGYNDFIDSNNTLVDILASYIE
ncbi:hypothetical protein HN748_05600 [Candidatus Peregrinibacteria bacterium]|jgi:hypothetical protein|nr:hypothetical protein [Candidatus Peregrinibacteria bacterium]MBT7483945.1 hypothetical protein [Candidatus Peregrinibacteria bacterium]MBT7703682.1 hypothetical protein [Candidatus Peregrinibacteria bacterium]